MSTEASGTPRTPVTGERAQAEDSPPGDRPGIPFEGEPVSSFHPLTAGAAVPGEVQPVPGPGLLLEEEPALWPDLDPSP